MVAMPEYIVVMSRTEGTLNNGYSTGYYSDMKRSQTLRGVIRHGTIVLDQADDFLIGRLRGDQLTRLQWMDNLRDDKDELAEVARQLGLSL